MTRLSTRNLSSKLIVITNCLGMKLIENGAATCCGRNFEITYSILFYCFLISISHTHFNTVFLVRLTLFFFLAKRCTNTIRKASITHSYIYTKRLSATRPSGINRRLQILSDGFDLRLEPIAFDIYIGCLLTRRAQAYFAVSLNYC